MKKLIERLLLFFVGLPLIVASVFFLPHYNYLFLHIEILLASLFAVLETRDILSRRLPVPNLAVSLVIGLLIPLASFSYAVFDLPYRVITSAIAISAALILCVEIVTSRKGEFADSIGRLASSFAILMYPGYLVMYLAIMTVRDHAGVALSLFFLMVFGCDSIAWFFGMLFGKGNRGVFAASPNKSVAGFVGGIVGSMAAGVGAYMLFPEVFGRSLPRVLILGLLTACASIVGDLVESVMKRSASMKDSGVVIPGRGGILDSIDSVLLAAPVYYILCDFLFGI